MRRSRPTHSLTPPSAPHTWPSHLKWDDPACPMHYPMLCTSLCVPHPACNTIDMPLTNAPPPTPCPHPLCCCSHTVRFGHRSSDEMCFAFIMWVICSTSTAVLLEWARAIDVCCASRNQLALEFCGVGFGCRFAECGCAGLARVTTGAGFTSAGRVR